MPLALGERITEGVEPLSIDRAGVLRVRYLNVDHDAGARQGRTRTELPDFAVKARQWNQAVLRDSTMRSSDEAVADGEDGRGGARLEVQFGQQMGDVATDGARAEREGLGDLAVAQALREQAQDLGFARG